jgi:glycine dehydrogenase subunit 1
VSSGGVDGVRLTAPIVREFAVRLDADVAAVRRRCLRGGINPGLDLHALTGREADRGGLLVAITERRSRAEIDRLVEALARALDAERRAEAPSETLVA